MESKNILQLLQICDSAFPVGGFSHSLGLEAFLKHNHERQINKDDLHLAFVCILENACSFSLPFIKVAYSAHGNADRLKVADEYCEACSSNHVAKRASSKQGNSLAEIMCSVYDNLPGVYKATIEEMPFGHFPVVFGSVMEKLGYSLDVIETAFLFSVVRTLVASAVRLDAVGAVEGQKSQLRLQELIPTLIKQYQEGTLDTVCLKYPMLDVLQNTQDTFYFKLFSS